MIGPCVEMCAEEAQHGASQAEIVVRLPLSLTPVVPRLVRIGDEFEAGMIVTLFGTSGQPFPVVVKLLADANAPQIIELLNNSRTGAMGRGGESAEEGQDICDPGDPSICESMN